MKIILFVMGVVFLFAGCEEKDIRTLKKECKEEGKKLKTSKIFNYREGKYELKNECL